MGSKIRTVVMVIGIPRGLSSIHGTNAHKDNSIAPKARIISIRNRKSGNLSTRRFPFLNQLHDIVDNSPNCTGADYSVAAGFSRVCKAGWAAGAGVAGA